MMGTTDEIVKVLEKGPVFMEDFPEEKWVVAIASPPYPISITPTKIPECWVNSVIIMTGSKFQGILTSKDILMRVFELQTSKYLMQCWIEMWFLGPLAVAYAKVGGKEATIGT